MKKMTLLSLVAATILFTGCGEETKKAASEATAATTEAVKKDSADAVDTAKAKAAEMAEAAKAKAAEMAEAAAEKAEAMKAAAAEKAEKVTAAVTDAVEAVTAETPTVPEVYVKCQGCHGVDGKTKAVGRSEIIAGQDKATLIASLHAYKAGTRNVSGMGSLMKGQVASMSDADIEAVAEYLSAIK